VAKRKRYFNTVGAIDPTLHYFLPHRLDWQLLLSFIEKHYYFVLHAPRQSGKTTAVLEFVQYLNQEKSYKALYLSIESARIAVNDVCRAVQVILEQCRNNLEQLLPREKAAIAYLDKVLSEPIQESGVSQFLRFWAKKNKKPLVVFFDEFDVLAGNSLIALLTQFRTGYTARPQYFPQTICLIGVRDLRDYKIKTKTEEELGLLYSPFNIKAESLVLPNFSLRDIQQLYEQHTKETGQVFTEETVQYVFAQTRGQPWLVNALAYQACFRDVTDRTCPITQDIIELARETLIKRCDTHLDALIDCLKEPRVRTIMDAIISGKELPGFLADDVQYVRDLGLLHDKELEIANPIYQEIIPRALIASEQQEIQQKGVWYQNKDGSLNVNRLLEAFTQFYRENAKAWLERFAYKEAGPHLLLLAFLQRVVNGGGTIHREYALGRKRMDLLVCFRQQRCVFELKIFKDKNTLIEGLCQIAHYMDEVGATEGHLIIFDRRDIPAGEKVYHTIENNISVWGL